MAKKVDRNKIIGASELADYLKSASAFAFELRCLERLKSLGFQCDHGGSYSDPVTKKSRQFDIRAYKHNRVMKFQCAIECKNLHKSSPLLVICVPRSADESFHDVVISYNPNKSALDPMRFDPESERCRSVRISDTFSPYRLDEFVGKSCTQVGLAPDEKNNTDDKIVADESEIYDRWSQALASADELAIAAGNDWNHVRSARCTVIIPIVVVPDGMLWKVEFDASGTHSKPVLANSCSFYVGHRFGIGSRDRTCFTITHLEFSTLSGLELLLKNPVQWDNKWFPKNELLPELSKAGGANMRQCFEGELNV